MTALTADGPLPGNVKKTRQHIVPKWLQRGFSNSKDPKRAQVAVYRKDSEPFFTNIANVGVQKSYFTSTYFDGDDPVTQLDGEFAALIDRLRGQQGPLAGEDKANACRLFAHLEVRHHMTEHNIREMWANILPLLFDQLRSEKNLKSWHHKSVLCQPDTVDAISRSCARRLRQARAHSRGRPANLRETVQFVADWVDSFRASVLALEAETGAAPESIAEEYAMRIERDGVIEDSLSYNRSRNMLLRPDAKVRVAGYSKFHWKIVKFPEDIVLPDSMVFHEVTDSPLIQNYLYVPVKQRASYLPITSRSALVCRSKPHRRRLPNATQMRHMAAQASFEYFIAEVRSEAYGRLKSRIGKLRPYATPAVWRLVARECLAH